MLKKPVTSAKTPSPDNKRVWGRWDQKKYHDLKKSGEEYTTTQADRIFYKFSGPRNLSKMLKAAGYGRNFSSVYRWSYPVSKGGTGGVVPSSAMYEIIHAARLAGIVLSLEDMDPRVISYIKTGPKPEAGTYRVNWYEGEAKGARINRLKPWQK